MPRAGLTAERVVAEAAALADRDGLSALTLATLAEALGVKVPSLYKHVDGLPELRRRLALAGMRDLDMALRDAVIGLAGADALRALGHAYRAYARTHPGRYMAAQRAPAPDDEELQRVGRSVTEVLPAVLRGYGFEGAAVVHAARSVRSALHGFAALEAAGGFGLPYDLDDSFAALLALLDTGLRSAAPEISKI